MRRTGWARRQATQPAAVKKVLHWQAGRGPASGGSGRKRKAGALQKMTTVHATPKCVVDFKAIEDNAAYA